MAESGEPAKNVKLWARRVWTLELSLVRINPIFSYDLLTNKFNLSGINSNSTLALLLPLCFLWTVNDFHVHSRALRLAQIPPSHDLAILPYLSCSFTRACILLHKMPATKLGLDLGVVDTYCSCLMSLVQSNGGWFGMISRALASVN